MFDSAYCASPFVRHRAPRSCRAFCRHTRGSMDENAAEFAADIPTFAHALRLRGYRTFLSGKMHFCGPDQLHQIEQRLTTDIYPADFNWTPDWDRPEHRPSWYHNMSSVRDAGLCVRSNQLDFDDEAAFMAERAIFDIARSRDPRPFLLRRLVLASARPIRRASALLGPLPRRGHRHADAGDASTHIRVVCATFRDRFRAGVGGSGARRGRACCGALAYVDDLLGRLMAALVSAPSPMTRSSS